MLFHIEIMGPRSTTVNFTIPADTVEDATARMRNLGHPPIRVQRAYDPMSIGSWAREWADAHGLAGVAAAA